MNISSLSFNSANLYTKSAPAATAASLPTAVSEGTDNTNGCDGGHGAGRPNRLAQALSAALREIGIGGPPSKADTPATTDTAKSAEPSAATASTDRDVSAAVEQFANALMDALGAGSGARGRGGEHRQGGEEGHYGRGHGPRDTRYGGFAQRLESLSQTVVQTPPTAQVHAAPATAAAPVTEVPISLPPTVESDLSVAATVPAPAPSAPAPAAAPTRSATSTLLDAFSRLFDALKPRATTDAPAADMATRLQQFLHTMAQTLSHTGLDGAAALQAGSFVDVKA